VLTKGVRRELRITTHSAAGTKAAQATLAKYAKKKASLHDDDLGDIERPVGGSDEAWVPAVPIRQRIKGRRLALPKETGQRGSTKLDYARFLLSSPGRTESGPAFCRNHAATWEGSNRIEEPTRNEGIMLREASL
jgi:hypothetical protein